MLPAANLTGRFLDKDLQGGMYRNKLFSVAWGLCPLGIIYNRKLMQEAGLSIPENWTLADFLTLCQKLKQVHWGRDIYSFGIALDLNVLCFTYNFLLAFNADIINDDNQIVLDSPEAIAAHRWLKGLYQKGNVVLTDDIWELRRIFAAQRLVFLLDGPWTRGILKDLAEVGDFDRNFGAVEAPVGVDSIYSSWNFNHALAIPSMSNQKESAAKFIDSLTSDPEICEIYFHEVGLLPPQRKMLASPAYRDHIYYQPFIQQLKRTRMMKADNPLIDKVIQFYADAARNIMQNNKDIETELREKAYYLRMLYN